MNDSGRTALITHYREQLSRIISGRRWIVANGVLVGAARMAKTLKSLGAEGVLAIGATRGVGPIPGPEELEMIDLGLTVQGSMMDGIRVSQRALDALPDGVQTQVDAFDPDGSALVVRDIFSSDVRVGGRAVFGGRPEAWRRLEDKMVIDALWDAAGLPRAPRQLVPTDWSAMKEAHEKLDRGMGTVWVGDNREGWHGGANLLRWVRTPTQQRQAHAFLAARADQARVMPFLDGIPCSIHGWVFPDETISLRPCEMLVFRIPGSDKLSYAGAATTWMPLEPVGTEMKAAAVRIGEHLRSTVGYRGAFTLDGVVTTDGFMPTELNPRFGAALGRMANSLADLPLFLLHLATAEGHELDFRPRDLENMIIHAVDSAPKARAMHILEGRFDLEPRQTDLICDNGTWREALEEEDHQVEVTLGKGLAGAIMFVTYLSDHLNVGVSRAPDLCHLLRFMSELWNLGIPPLEAAPDVQRDELTL